LPAFFYPSSRRCFFFTSFLALALSPSGGSNGVERDRRSPLLFLGASALMWTMVHSRFLPPSASIPQPIFFPSFLGFLAGTALVKRPQPAVLFDQLDALSSSS